MARLVLDAGRMGRELDSKSFTSAATDHWPAPGESIAPPPPRRGDVLVVTRDGDDPDGLSGALERAGYRARVARADARTLEATLQSPPDIIIADVPNGDRTVLAFVSCVSSELGNLAPPAIAIAAADDEATSTFERFFEAGVRDVLAKPVPSSLLRVKVARFATKRRDIARSFGPYEIRSVLGRGAMGTVYLAARDGEEVALKVLETGTRGLEPEALARFRREAEVLRLLRSEWIPRLIDAGRHDDHFYYAMEFVRGETLASILDRGPLGPESAARIIDEIAAALEVIHGAGLVHRDVKPTNVIVTPAGPAKLVDFGLAKAIGDQSLTRQNEILGTAPYMAPEMVRDGVTSALTDAYALGMTGLEALLGTCPFTGSSDDVAAKICRGEIPRAKDLLAHSDRQLVAILDGLLAPAAEHRLSAAEARAALRVRKSLRGLGHARRDLAR